MFIGAYFIFACWLMFASLNSANGKLKISGRIASDFGPNTALVQSFAVGKNFPTQYPHFAGERIRYHFLFWFQAGNLEFLGLDPAWSINLLSIFSMVALLMLTMVLGEMRGAMNFSGVFQRSSSFLVRCHTFRFCVSKSRLQLPFTRSRAWITFFLRFTRTVARLGDSIHRIFLLINGTSQAPLESCCWFWSFWCFDIAPSRLRK